MIQTDPIAFSPSIPLDSTEKLWEWHIPSDRLFFSKGTRLAFGLSDGESPATMAAFFEHIPEGCLQSLCELREGVIGGDRGFLETAYPVENFFVRERLFVLERDAEGRAIRMGWLDRLDVLRWMEVADTLFGGNTQMVVHGISMGAATTMMVAGESQRPYVKCFVEDCGYTSVWDEFSNELKTSFELPAFPLMHTASWLCDLKYGWNFREASALAQVAKCELPMLFIHGDADDYVPTRMVYPLYGAKPGDKELWVVPGASHANSYRDNREEYTRRVGEFVGRYIGGRPE